MQGRKRDAFKIAKQLGIGKNLKNADDLDTLPKNQASVIDTIAKSVKTGKSKSFKCPKCSRSYTVPNAKDTAVYKCGSCKVKLDIIGASKEEDDSELMLDETLPEEVREALKSPANAFGKYVLLERLGEGAMGFVQKAFDVELSRFVALKFVKSQSVDELKQEARMLAGLDHKNIAKIFEIGSNDGVVFISMQFIRGESLDRFRLERDRALRVLITICEAVEWAHRHNIIHRDIKPENVMIDTEGNVFILDFGLATKTRRAKGGEVEITGTPGFIAPEVVLGKGSSKRSDIFAIGALMYYLLSGRRPVEFKKGETLESILKKCEHGLPKKLRDVDRSIPADLSAIVEKASAASTAARYASPTEMAMDIKNFLRGDPVGAFSQSITYRAKKSIRKNAMTFVVSSLVVLAVLGTAAYLIFRKGEQTQEPTPDREDSTAAKILKSFIGELSMASDQAIKRRMEGESQRGLQQLAQEKMNSYKTLEANGVKNELVHCALGTLYRMIGDVETARSQHQLALKIKPAHAQSLYELGLLAFNDYVRKITELRNRWYQAENERLAQSGTSDIGWVEPKNEELEDDDARSSRSLSMKYLDGALPGFKKDCVEAKLIEGILAYLEGNPADSESKLRDIESSITKESYSVAVEDGAMLLDQIYVSQKKLESALRILSAVLKIDLGNKRVYVERALLYQGMAQEKSMHGGDPKSEFQWAVDDCTAALKLDPDDFLLWKLRASIRLDSGIYKADRKLDPSQEYAAALSDINEATSRNSKDFDCFMLRGKVKYCLGNYRSVRLENPIQEFTDAIGDYDAAQKLNATSAEVYVRRGKAFRGIAVYNYSNAGDAIGAYEKARSEFDKAISLSPGNFEAWYNRGIVLLDLGPLRKLNNIDPWDIYQDALKNFEKAINLRSENYFGYLYRGITYYRLVLIETEKGKDPSADSENGIRDLNAGLKLNSQVMDLWNMRGAFYLNLGLFKRDNKLDASADFRNAVNDFTQVIKVSPQVYEGYNNRAVTREYLYAQTRAYADLDGAAADYYDAYKIKPTMSNLLTKAISCKMIVAGLKVQSKVDPSKDVQFLITELEKKYQNDASNEVFLSGRAAARTFLIAAIHEGIITGDKAELSKLVHADCEAAIRKNPNTADAYMARGLVHYYEGKYKPAVDDLETSKKLNPKLASSVDIVLEKAKAKLVSEEH